MTAGRLTIRFCCHSCIGAKTLLGLSSRSPKVLLSPSTLEDMGHNMSTVMIAGHKQEDRQKDVLHQYNLTGNSQAFRRVAELSQKCSSCSGKPAEGQTLLQCNRCRQAFYCDRNCQKEHWRQGHKSDCCPQPEWRDNATRSSLVAYHP